MMKDSSFTPEKDMLIQQLQNIRLFDNYRTSSNDASLFVQ